MARSYVPDAPHPGSIIFMIVMVCLAVPLVIGHTHAGDQAGKEESATSKAVAREKAIAQDVNTDPDSVTREEAQAVDPTGKEGMDDPITCLARTIYWEARSSGIADMEAIASVVINRLGSEGFPQTICSVVKEGQKQGACQFSWWCDGRPDSAQNEKSYAVAKEVARKAINGQLKDRSGGALYFHRKGSRPDWAEEYIKTATIKDHVFYKPGGGEAK